MEQARKPGMTTECFGRRVVDGVPGLAWGKTGDSTLAGALVAATSVTPFPCDYDTLMGTTGLAYRVRWYRGVGDARWTPSSPVGEFQDEVEAARRATGWRLRVEWEEGDMGRLATDIDASIAAGLPVLAYEEDLNVAVIFGTEDAGDTVLTHDYYHGDECVTRRTASLRVLAIFLDEHIDPVPPQEAALHGLRLGARNFHRRHDPPENESIGYWMGAAAFEKWSEDLGLVGGLSQAERTSLYNANWLTFETLTDARFHAGPFLRKACPWFPAQAQAEIQKAAEIYEGEAKKLRVALYAGESFTGPSSGKTIVHWSAAVRKAEQQMLASVAQVEAEAMGHVDAALAAIP